MTKQVVLIYQSAGCKLEEQASDNRAEQLGDPVQDTSNKSDVASDEGAEGDGWVYMST